MSHLVFQWVENTQDVRFKFNWLYAGNLHGFLCDKIQNLMSTAQDMFDRGIVQEDDPDWVEHREQMFGRLLNDIQSVYN